MGWRIEPAIHFLLARHHAAAHIYIWAAVLITDMVSANDNQDCLAAQLISNIRRAKQKDTDACNFHAKLSSL